MGNLDAEEGGMNIAAILRQVRFQSSTFGSTNNTLLSRGWRQHPIRGVEVRLRDPELSPLS